MSFVAGKVALITGGASGIGLSYAKELLRNGLKAVTIADINPTKGEEAVKAITEEFGKNRVHFTKTDVSKNEEIEGAFEKAVKTFNNLDIVINNAGIMDDSIWEKEIAINFNGSVKTLLLGIDKYLPKYRSGPEGLIVNISSVAGLAGFGCLPVYTGTKHAIIGLTKAFSVKEHYDRTKVRVVAICPGVTETPLITESYDKNLGPAYKKILEADLKAMPVQQPEAVARRVVQVIQEAETGSIWIVDDGELIRVHLPDLATLLKK